MVSLKLYRKLKEFAVRANTDCPLITISLRSGQWASAQGDSGSMFPHPVSEGSAHGTRNMTVSLVESHDGVKTPRGLHIGSILSLSSFVVALGVTRTNLSTRALITHNHRQPLFCAITFIWSSKSANFINSLSLATPLGGEAINPFSRRGHRGTEGVSNCPNAT